MSSGRENCLTKIGADRIAQKIENYWLERGREPRVYLTTISVEEHGRAGSIYMVRSNMVGGMPAARPE